MNESLGYQKVERGGGKRGVAGREERRGAKEKNVCH